MLGGLLRLLCAPFVIVAALRRLLVRLIWIAHIAAFAISLAGEAADAQLFVGVTPWDRAEEPIDDQATDTSPEEPEETGACSGLIPAPMMGGCAVIRGTEAAGNALETAANSALESLMLAVGDGAAWFLGKVAAFLDASTPPALTAPWFTGQYDTMAALAAVVVLPLVLVAIIDAIVHGRPGQILRSLFVYLPLAGIVTVVATELVGLALDVTDWASLVVSGEVAADSAGFLEQIGQTLARHDTALPVFAVFIGGLFTLFGALVLWIELLLRTAGIHIAVLFLPLAFATMVWPRIAQWASRALRTLTALIFSKFFIVAVISLGASLLGSIANAPTRTPTAGMREAAATSGLETVVAGIALISLACFAPWVLWRLLAPVEGAMDTALEGATRRPTAAASHPHVRDLARLGSASPAAQRNGTTASSLPVAGVTASGLGLGRAASGDSQEASVERPTAPRTEPPTTASPNGTGPRSSAGQAAGGSSDRAAPGAHDDSRAAASPRGGGIATDIRTDEPPPSPSTRGNRRAPSITSLPPRPRPQTVPPPPPPRTEKRG